MARVVVAMSGGVDSSVAAALLVEEGHEVIGVHMKLHDADPESAGHCCGLDDALDARRVADTLGVAFHVMDLREAFRRAVIDDLTSTYIAGATPNPCVQCNGVLKFRVLLQRALALGATQLVTGHYAQIRDGALLQAVDGDKDQSYFLFQLTPKALALSRFPLGGMRKSEVRAHATRLGLVTANKPESQEICFIPDQDHAGFIARERPDLDGSGDIVDPAGQVVGRHDGYWRFTIGQRRGLGVAMGRKVYVRSIDPATGRVVIDSEDALWHQGLVAQRWVWHERPSPGETVRARIRHRGGLIPCTVGEGDAPELCFEQPAWAVAPGQAVVLYKGQRVVGGGWIRRATQPTREAERVSA